MNDYYLKFDNEAQADSIIANNYKNVDKIGTIYVPSMQVDEEGNTIMEALSGFHVNIRVLDSEDPSSLDTYAVTPTNPVRVWG